MDVVSNATYGEGFGLPAVEAQACGTPVIVSRGTTGPQLAGPARWLVPVQRRWNWVHGAWWHAPSEDGILARYEQAWQARGSSSLRVKCRDFAVKYSVEAVAPLWDAVIARLTGDA
jgi:glycosyltransferase involved in cell wall biosynthesis